MDRALLARVEKQAIFHRFPRSIPIAIFLLGIAVTVLFALNTERSDAVQRRAVLETDSAALINEIERQFSENTAYLKAAGSFFSIADDFDRKDFGTFFQDMSVDHQQRGSLGIGWADWTTGSSAASILATASQTNARVPLVPRPTPSSPTQPMALISLIEPVNQANATVLGFDMYSEAVRREAIDAAARQRRATATAPVHLLQDKGKAGVTGFLVYLAVFDASGASTARLRGFVYTPIRARDFLARAVEKSGRSPGRIALYDGRVATPNLLSEIGERNGGDIVARTFDAAGRSWTLVTETRAVPGLTRTSLLVLILGGIISALLASLGRIVTARAVDDRKVLEWLTSQNSIRNSLTRELNHRVKNTLANVLSIVALTRRRSKNLDEFADGLVGRIRALSATHDLLGAREWENAPVGAIVESELAPYLDPDDPHVSLSGPEVLLTPNDAMSLGLALHELATNAAKYGALSTPQGHVSVTWREDGADKCELTWEESGGPPVVAPTRRGFGIDLIEKIVSAELSSPIRIEFDPAGVKTTLRVPVRNNEKFRLHARSAE